MYALIDCNNFFVSCERTLDDSLIGKPVVVLSNGDGCIVSRSNEAKALGIPMGAPVFQYKELFKLHNVQSFSAKFELYNFRSQQVMEIAKSYAPDYEVYSIDELFLDFHGFKYFDLHLYCQQIREKILEVSKIPTSIGIAPTKTLCKIANTIAKKYSEKFNNVYFLDTPEKIEKALKWLNIEDVWGIGRRLALKMKSAGVYKAWDLLQKPQMWVRKMMGIHGIRMINELKGIPQLKLDSAPVDKKSIAVTRSFTKMITEKQELKERIETFAVHCAEKLRKQNSCCKELTVFIHTNRFRDDLPVYRNEMTFKLPLPSSSSINLAHYASTVFSEIFKEGFQYKKAGVIVSNFVPEDERQGNLFEKDLEPKHSPVMKAMDRLNKKYGKEKVRLGSMSGKNTFSREKLSPEYEFFLKNNTLSEANYRFH